MKRIITVMLTAVMVVSMAIPAEADSRDWIISRSSITLIKNQKIDLFLFDQNIESIAEYVNVPAAEEVASSMRNMNGTVYRGLSWASSKPKIVSVNSNGTIKAKRPGRAVISVSYMGKTYKCKVKVVKALSAKQRQKLAKKEAHRIVRTYTNSSMSQKEKAQVLAFYLIENVGSQHNQSSKIYKKNYGNEAYSALVMHLSACSGHCKAYKMLCNEAGIKCKHVNAGKWSHQWNKVYIDGKWYSMDTQGGYSGLGWDTNLAIKAFDVSRMGPVYLKKKRFATNLYIEGKRFITEEMYI